jgi:hypothetical protein
MTTFILLRPAATLRGQGSQGDRVTAIFRYFGWRSSPSSRAYSRTTRSIASGSMRGARPGDIGPVPGEVEIRAFPCSGLRIHREGIAAAAFARDTHTYLTWCALWLVSRRY